MKHILNLLIPVLIFANGAAFKEAPSGGGVIPYNIENVQLIYENILIDTVTDCEFRLYNLNDSTVNFTMGFPFQKVFLTQDLVDMNFTVIVHSEDSATTAAYRLVNNDSSAEYERVFIWDVSIPARKSITVNCSYNTVWSWHSADFGYEDSSHVYLRTPANYWHGTVTEAHFELRHVTTESFTSHEYTENVQIEPEGYIRTENGIAWHEYNVHSMSDIKYRKTREYQQTMTLSLTTIDSILAVAFGSILKDSLIHPINCEVVDVSGRIFVPQTNIESFQDIDSLLDSFVGYLFVECGSTLEDGMYCTPYNESVSILNSDFVRLKLLRIMRNYYYARNGWKFNDPWLNNVFNIDTMATHKVAYDDFSAIEKHNIAMLKEYEERYYIH